MLAPSHRGYCATRTETYTAYSSRDRGEGINAKLLEPRPVLLEGKQSRTKLACPNPPHPHPIRLIHKEAAEHCTPDRRSSTSSSWPIQRALMTLPILPGGWSPGTKATRTHRRYTPFPREKGYSSPQSRNPAGFGSERGLGDTYLKSITKKNPLFINLIKKTTNNFFFKKGRLLSH